MPIRIKWLKRALKDLDEEISYIAGNDPVAARVVARRIKTAVALLAIHPSIGRPGRVSGTRELVIPKTRYLIPYRARRDVIEIMRVFHGSRRPPTRW